MGQGITTPIIPLFANSFAVSTTVVGIVVAAFGFSRLFVNIPAGMVGQKFGRTVLMAAGLLVVAGGNFMSGIAPSVGLLVLARAITGAGSAAFMTGAVAYVADVSTPGNRARLMAVQQGSLLVGATIGPIIGGVLGDQLGLRWPFYAAGILAAVAAVWTGARLPNRPPHWSASPATPRNLREATTANRRWSLGSAGQMLRNPTFVIVGLFTLMVFFTRSGARMNLIPLMATEQLHMSRTMLGAMIFAMTGVNFVTVWPSGWLSDRFGRKSVMVPGMLVTALGLWLFAISPSVITMFIAAVVIGAGTGIAGSSPQAYVADLAPAGQSSMAIGLYRTFGDMGFVIGPILLGWIAEGATKGLALNVNALLVVGIALVFGLLARETVGKRRRA